MNGSEREPFPTQPEPFTSCDGPQDGMMACESVVESPFDRFDTIGNDNSSNGEDTTPAMEIESPKRVKTSVPLSGDTRWRLRCVASYEDRTMTEIIEDAIRVFLDRPDNEPRPYIPSEQLIAPTTRTGFEIGQDLNFLLDTRSMLESRDRSVLIYRAILDYIEASPGNPRPREAVQ